MGPDATNWVFENLPNAGSLPRHSLNFRSVAEDDATVERPRGRGDRSLHRRTWLLNDTAESVILANGAWITVPFLFSRCVKFP